jgi:hypothetical protein
MTSNLDKYVVSQLSEHFFSAASLSSQTWRTSLNVLLKHHNFQKSYRELIMAAIRKGLKYKNPFSCSLEALLRNWEALNKFGDLVIMELHPSSSPSSRDSSASHLWDFIDRFELYFRFITKSTRGFPSDGMASASSESGCPSLILHIPVIWAHYIKLYRNISLISKVNAQQINWATVCQASSQTSKSVEIL